MHAAAAVQLIISSNDTVQIADTAEAAPFDAESPAFQFTDEEVDPALIRDQDTIGMLLQQFINELYCFFGTLAAGLRLSGGVGHPLEK